MSDTLLSYSDVAPQKQQTSFSKTYGPVVKDLVSMLPAYLIVSAFVASLSLGWVL